MARIKQTVSARVEEPKSKKAAEAPPAPEKPKSKKAAEAPPAPAPEEPKKKRRARPGKKAAREVRVLGESADTTLVLPCAPFKRWVRSVMGEKTFKISKGAATAMQALLEKSERDFIARAWLVTQECKRHTLMGSDLLCVERMDGGSNLS
jgi:histone H3/H4